MTEPLDEFIRIVTKARDACEEVCQLLDDHLYADPDEITWGHVGTARDVLYRLRAILGAYNN